MIDRDEETYCLTLRAVRPWTADVLYEAKTLTGEPIYRWAPTTVRPDPIVTPWCRRR